MDEQLEAELIEELNFIAADWREHYTTVREAAEEILPYYTRDHLTDGYTVLDFSDE